MRKYILNQNIEGNFIGTIENKVKKHNYRKSAHYILAKRLKYSRANIVIPNCVLATNLCQLKNISVFENGGA